MVSNGTPPYNHPVNMTTPLLRPLYSDSKKKRYIYHFLNYGTPTSTPLIRVSTWEPETKTFELFACCTGAHLKITRFRRQENLSSRPCLLLLG